MFARISVCQTHFPSRSCPASLTDVCPSTKTKGGVFRNQPAASTAAHCRQIEKRSSRNGGAKWSSDRLSGSMARAFPWLELDDDRKSTLPMARIPGCKDPPGSRGTWAGSKRRGRLKGKPTSNGNQRLEQKRVPRKVWLAKRTSGCKGFLPLDLRKADRIPLRGAT